MKEKNREAPSHQMRSQVADEMIRAVAELTLLTAGKASAIRIEVDYRSGEEQAFERNFELEALRDRDDE